MEADRHARSGTPPDATPAPAAGRPWRRTPLRGAEHRPQRTAHPAPDRLLREHDGQTRLPRPAHHPLDVARRAPERPPAEGRERVQHTVSRRRRDRLSASVMDGAPPPIIPIAASDSAEYAAPGIRKYPDGGRVRQGSVTVAEAEPIVRSIDRRRIAVINHGELPSITCYVGGV